jgi:hypothetical protein
MEKYELNGARSLPDWNEIAQSDARDGNSTPPEQRQPQPRASRQQLRDDRVDGADEKDFSTASGQRPRIPLSVACG